MLFVYSIILSMSQVPLPRCPSHWCSRFEVEGSEQNTLPWRQENRVEYSSFVYSHIHQTRMYEAPTSCQALGQVLDTPWCANQTQQCLEEDRHGWNRQILKTVKALQLWRSSMWCWRTWGGAFGSIKKISWWNDSCTKTWTKSRS